MINNFADVRIEIMQALLNNAVISSGAFNAIAALFENIDGEDDEAWAAYKAQSSTPKAAGGLD